MSATGKMAGMIPGLSGMMGGMDDDEGSAKLKRMIYVSLFTTSSHDPFV